MFTYVLGGFNEQWTGLECIEPRKPCLLDEDEFKVILNEFLLGISSSPAPSSGISDVSADGARTITEFIGSIASNVVVTAERFTLDDVLNCVATKELRAVLFQIYGQFCVWPTLVEESKLIAIATSERKVSQKPLVAKKKKK